MPHTQGNGFRSIVKIQWKITIISINHISVSIMWSHNLIYRNMIIFTNKAYWCCKALQMINNFLPWLMDTIWLGIVLMGIFCMFSLFTHSAAYSFQWAALAVNAVKTNAVKKSVYLFELCPIFTVSFACFSCVLACVYTSFLLDIFGVPLAMTGTISKTLFMCIPLMSKIVGFCVCSHATLVWMWANCANYISCRLLTHTKSFLHATEYCP